MRKYQPYFPIEMAGAAANVSREKPETVGLSAAN
jgi:hypothetical protein